MAWPLVVLAAVFVVAQVLRDRERDARAAADREALIGVVRDLCQRIQAPDVAVATHATQDLDLSGKQYASLESDAEVQHAIDALDAFAAGSVPVYASEDD